MTPAEIFNTLEGIRNLSQLKVDKKDINRLNELLTQSTDNLTEKEKETRQKTIQGLEKKIAATNSEQNQKKIQEALEKLKKTLYQEEYESWIKAFSSQFSNDWKLSVEEKVLNKEQLIKILPNVDVSKYNPLVYAKILPYAKLLYTSGQKGSPEEHAYKLSMVFDKEDDALKYLKTALNREQPKYELLLMNALPNNKKPLKNKIYFEKEGNQLKYTMKSLEGEDIIEKINIDVSTLSNEVLAKLHDEILEELSKKGQIKPHTNMDDACSFSLPLGEYDLKTWQKLCVKFLDKPEFFPILSQASAIEGLIKKIEKEKPPATSVEIRKITSEIEKLNSAFKDLKRKHDQIKTPVKIKEYNDLLNELNEKRRELTTLGVPFNEQLTISALESFREIYNIDNSPVLKYFLNKGLTKQNYEKFIALERNNAGTNIPDIKLDGTQFGHPGYYFMKIPVQNDLHAARAACLGKLTNCCQSLSGESGEPCVKHALTSPNGGFYVICQGNINEPKVEDKVIGQSWVWRSQTNALVFDSIETVNKEQDTIALVKDFYEKAAKKLVLENHTHKVSCGDASGISSEIGIDPESKSKEFFIDYASYNDSAKQRLIIDKSRPFYWYNVDEDCTIWTKGLLKNMLSANTPLIRSNHFQAFISWAMKDDKKELLNLMKDYAKNTPRENELNQIISNIEKHNRDELSGNEMLELIEKNLFFVDTPNNQTTTLLMQAANKGDLKNLKKLIELGADVNLEENYKKMDEVLEKEMKEKLRENVENFNIIENIIEDYTKRGMTQKYNTALTYAADGGHNECVLELIKNGAHINYADSYEDRTPLLSAANSGHDDTVKILLQNGANINAKTYDGNSALLMAIQKNNVELALFLIKKGAALNAVRLCPMNDLPNNDPNQAKPHKIYLSLDGKYVTRDPNGMVQQGQVTDFFGLENLFLKPDYHNIEDFIKILEERKHVHVNAANSNYNSHTDEQTTSPLGAALDIGNPSIILALLKNGADSEILYDGKTLLAYAKGRQWTDIVDYIEIHELSEPHSTDKLSNDEILELIKNNQLNVDTPNNLTTTLLMKATNKGDLKMVEKLIELGADVNLQENYDNWDQTKFNERLEKISATGKVFAVKDYEDFYRDIKYLSKDKTALMYAASNGNLPILKLLISSKAKLNISDTHGMTALMHAAENGNNECVLELIKNGASIEFGEGPYQVGYTPLLCAARSGHEETVKILLQNGANVNAKDWYGNSALLMAIQNNYSDLALFLIKSGAALNAVRLCRMEDLPNNDSNQAKLHKIYLSLDGEYVTRDPNGVVQQGRVTNFLGIIEDLFLKPDYDNFENFLKILIEKNHMHINAANRNYDTHTQAQGISPLSAALDRGNQSIVLALIENGADRDVTYDRQTLLEYANSHQWTEVVNYIHQNEKQKKDITRTLTKPVTFRTDDRSSIAKSPDLPESGSIESDPAKNKPG